MKIKSFLFGALALAAVVVGCNKPDNTKGTKLEVKPETVEATAEGDTYSLAVTADCGWVATTSAEWLSVTPAQGTGNATVTVTVDDNEGDARVAKIHFQKVDAREVFCEVQVKQAAADVVPEIIEATVAEFNAAQVGDQKYRLTGKVSADAAINTTYGNFDLVDATGSVYVYGLSNIEDMRDKLLANADIVIVGVRYEYNGKIEVKDAVCESIEGGDEPEPAEGTVYEATDFTWSENTNATYGAGYQGVKTGAPTLGYYKYESTSNPVAQSGDHIRIYKNSAFVVSSQTAFTKLIMTATDSKYAVAATVLVGGGTVTADDAKLTITWEGPATKNLVLQATEGQIRASKFEFVFGEGEEEEGEHYTLDQVNAMDCYIYGYGDGRYVCDCDLYVADVENNTYSHNLDVYVPLIINEQTKIAGNHTMAIDPDYYEYYGYTTNEGVFSAFTEGTMNISYVSQSLDSDGDNVYFYNVVIAGKLQNGQAFNLTVNKCRVYAVDVDDEEWPYINLTDGATKAAIEGKAVKTVKANRQIITRK